MTDESFWPVRIKGDVTVCVSPTIHQMTSYVLLEQEDWFEDEMDFVRALTTPDMNAFDIGANHGVYGLTIARRLATGHVWAFEPTIAPGTMLAKSVELNGLGDRITWVHAGLSDHDGEADIGISADSETNSLQGAGTRTERITLRSLDAFVAREGIETEIHFVKLDAEGEEIRILAGGRDFFSRQSPLVMFELRHGNQVNHGLIEMVRSSGYDIYRLLPGLDILVEYSPLFQDGFLLNLFACKPDRAAELARRGLLATREDIAAQANEQPEAPWQERLFTLPFAAPQAEAWRAHAPRVDPDYDFALSACLAAQDRSLTPARRVTLARAALARITAIADSGKGDIALWLLRLNLTHLLGERTLSLGITQKLAGLPETTFATLKPPYLPPSPRFYDRPACGTHAGVMVAIREFIEYRQAFSSYFSNAPLNDLAALSARSDHGIEIDRRLILSARRRGMPVNIPDSHDLFQPGRSANSAIWHGIAR
ncbi:FkbM family methyltransferase [Rhizobium sp. TH2]|uniref:FkbM family methyltransferase n=1 Tax=Rhizobium sp. TH2 TaxID=2775403 RepID=UPI002157F43C|nr:FkbM family methyltransferase [Rhizobium sp. TH2]UVC06747.1 FkbM family methyltransferase [Rhizobium sp. TH2]